MAFSVQVDKFRFREELHSGVAGKRVLVTSAEMEVSAKPLRCPLDSTELLRLGCIFIAATWTDLT